jgi:hypothetical protein
MEWGRRLVGCRELSRAHVLLTAVLLALGNPKFECYHP